MQNQNISTIQLTVNQTKSILFAYVGSRFGAYFLLRMTVETMINNSKQSKNIYIIAITH